MTRPLAQILILGIIITGCNSLPYNYSKKDIVKITDFELSPDEERIAFSAITPVGNLDIWVVDIDGKNLKKLTFQDRSPTNHIARFFKRRKWRNYFEIDMHYPGWTSDGRIIFCQGLTKHDIWGIHTVSLRYWTINLNGRDKRQRTEKDRYVETRPFDPINRSEVSSQSQKHHKKILLKDSWLWSLDYGESNLKSLIQ